MKRINLFLIAAALLVAASFSVSTARANGQLDEILANMQKAASGIKSVKADLHQEKRLGDLGGKEINNGKLWFRHEGKGSDKVKIEYFRNNKPSQVVWVVGNEIWFYQPPINQVILTTRSSQASKNQEFSFIATPYTSVPELKSQYNIVHKGDDGGAAVLELTPKRKSSVKQLTLWVNKSTWVPTRYHVVESNGDQSTFVLNNMQLNVAISAGMFKKDWPSGTKEIRR
ncbi:MAG TPA: outer membrane lipoprotein carrier protein LolA [Blastocatellia bacterium]|nr:outer membrane lipoprotein carrier protein LolA [Blastocatellia bacterium]